MGSSGFVPGKLLVLNGKNFDDWCLNMDAIFCLQDVEEIVKNEFNELGRNASNEKKKIHKEAKKMDCKAQLLIHQCVDATNIRKFSKATTTKKAQDILNKAYGNADKTKKVKL